MCHLPVRCVCQARRLLCNWHILQLEESELLFKFYSAQQLKPGKNDWVRQIEKDKNELNINLSDLEVKNMTKLKFKQIVMMRIHALAAKHFTAIQSKQQKTKQLKISDKLTPAKYLFSSKLCHDEIRTLFRLRCSTIDAKLNMSSLFKENKWCRTCFLFPESQEHLFSCLDIREKLKDVDFSGIKYEMIYGHLHEQEKIAKVYHLILQARSDILNS